MADIRFQTLNLNLLRVFDALYQARNVPRAAEVLGVTQPAVSHALGQLRTIFADELFARQGAVMMPTPLALEIGPRIQAALRQMQEALSPRPFDPATTDRVFTIAAGDNVGTVLAPEIVGAIRDRAPHARVRILPLSVDVVSGLDEGGIDVVINSFSEIPERMVCDRLWSDAPIWMTRAGHPVLARPVDAAHLATLDRVVVDLAMTQVGMSPDGFVARRGLTQWASADEPPSRLPHRIADAQHRVVVPSFHTAIALVRRSDLVTLLPRRLGEGVARDLGLVPIETIGPVPQRTLMALWSSEWRRHPAISWLRSLILESAGHGSTKIGEDGAAA